MIVSFIGGYVVLYHPVVSGWTYDGQSSTLNPLIPVPNFIRLSPEGAKVLLEFLTNFRLCWSLFSTQPALCRAAKKNWLRPAAG